MVAKQPIKLILLLKIVQKIELHTGIHNWANTVLVNQTYLQRGGIHVKTQLSINFCEYIPVTSIIHACSFPHNCMMQNQQNSTLFFFVGRYAQYCFTIVKDKPKTS